ncbi:restriction endonuclease subunit S [Sporosarcina sp. PTS2304]|uniref:restriction endonuclease subunit S n=1 Tax=Sporosarcina sp. PTS2304 TaxID=2283194 RepID=UPI000E0E0324|nr:restriction endonuclease subunit S [Sporosarcina sp. PTS2304]AXI00259.1 restriction endonuclease subunit S [Sporosarcina sp. PTS2304]
MEFKITEIGKMPSHWQVVSIEQIGDVVGGGTPSTKREDYYGGEVSWITPKDLSGHTKRKISRGARNITELGLNNSSARLLPKETVLLSSRAPIGYVAIADKEVSTNQGFKSIICDKNKIQPIYLYYVLKESKERLESVATGSTFKEVSGSSVKKFEIALPPLNEQRIISRILSSIDSKIEINQDIINNFEQLAQTLFKRWFVDFEFPNENGDPYKSSGGEMVESELGMIPAGWKEGTLNDIGAIVGGGTPSKKIDSYYTTQGYSWITPKDLSNDKSVYIFKGSLDITEEALKKSSAKLHPTNTVLFSSRAPIGYVAIAGQEVATNQGFKSIIPKKEVPSEYIYLLLKHLTPVIESNASGSTFKEISGAGMKGIKVVVPLKEILADYKSIVKPLFKKVKETEIENKSLTSLRDTLLPKLLSGEIELPNETEVTEDVPIS